MNYDELFAQIRKKRSFLCVGLDTDKNKIPPHLLLEDDPVFAFNRAVIESTLPYAVAYKPNMAFYEALGTSGWESLVKTLRFLRQKAPDVFIIVDAKRGDIGNTSAMYARTFFDELDADAVTLSPYMGKDTVEPFLRYRDKWVVLLALTSNPSAADFQFLEDKNGQRLFEKVVETSRQWASAGQMMYVVGATKAQELRNIRKQVPEYFLLVPGVGAQGGSLEETARYGLNDHGGLLVNSSRKILYASSGKDFALKAGEEAGKLQKKMETLLKEHHLL